MLRVRLTSGETFPGEFLLPYLTDEEIKNNIRLFTTNSGEKSSFDGDKIKVV